MRNDATSTIVRTAALELYSAKDHEVIKVAGILDKLKNIFKRITDGNYTDSIGELRGDSSMVQSTSLHLKERIEDLQKAIKGGDVIGYDVALDSVRELTSQLSAELGKLNQDATQNSPRAAVEKSQGQPVSSTRSVSEQPVQELTPKGLSENKIGDYYTYEQQQLDPSKLVNNVIQSIKNRHPDFPVPIGRDLNIPVLDPSLNNWFGKNEIEISSAMRPRVIDAIVKGLVNKVPIEMVEEILSTNDGWNAFAKRLSNAVYNGTLIHYIPMKANKPTKDSKEVKQRQVGEMMTMIRTSDFKFPVLNAKINMIVYLNDISPRVGDSHLMKLMQILNVQGEPTVYPLIRPKSDAPTIVPPKPIDTAPALEPTAPIEPVVTEPVLPEPALPKTVLPEPILPEPIKTETEKSTPEEKKKTRKSRKKAFRKEFLNSFVKTADIQSYSVTKLSDVDFAKVLANGYKLVFGTSPSLETLGAAWAQGVLESGRPVSLPNNNIGNIKATKDWLNSNKPYFIKDTKEIDKNRKEYIEHGTKWRAYDSPEEGAAGYWRLIGNKFKDAFQWMASGDAVNAAVSLGQKGYYTADIKKYSGAVGSLFNDFMIKIAPDLPDIKSNPQPPPVLSNSSLTSIPQNDNVQDLLSVLVAVGPVESIVRKSLLEDLLPTSNVLISLSSRNIPFDIRIKFANTLAKVLTDTIDAKVNIHTDEQKIELMCSALGSQYSVLTAVKALYDCVATGIRISSGLEVRAILVPSVISKFAKIG